MGLTASCNVPPLQGGVCVIQNLSHPGFLLLNIFLSEGEPAKD